MEFLELYFEAKYLTMVIPCVLVLVAVILVGIVMLINKIITLFHKRLGRKTNEKIERENNIGD